MEITDANDESTRILDTIERAVIADREFFETVLVGILAEGHVLLEDVPGTGKTLTARSIATVLGLSFSRVQFTPDLLPADITGTHVFNQRDRNFEFREGPVFANVVLADELNRAPPKTQSALLEAMEERQVTVEGETHPLPEPFFVLATQNPVEQEGTFELPEAQKDRFMVKSQLGYPDVEGEREILFRRLGRTETTPSVEPVLSPERVRELQAAPETVQVHDDLVEYITDVSRATRQDRRVNVGVSPRGTQRLLETCRAHTIIAGREFVTPHDVKRVAESTLAHRLVLTPEAMIDSTDKRAIIADVLDSVPVPTVESSTG